MRPCCLAVLFRSRNSAAIRSTRLSRLPAGRIAGSPAGLPLGTAVLPLMQLPAPTSQPARSSPLLPRLPALCAAHRIYEAQRLKALFRSYLKLNAGESFFPTLQQVGGSEQLHCWLRSAAVHDGRHAEGVLAQHHGRLWGPSWHSFHPWSPPAGCRLLTSFLSNLELPERRAGL